MGFFGNLKQKMVGGLDVVLTVATSIETGQATLDGQVSLTAKNQAQPVKKVTFQLEQRVWHQNMVNLNTIQIGNSSGMNNNEQMQVNVLANVELTEPFTLQPVENKVIPFQLALSSQTSNAEVSGIVSILHQAATTLGSAYSKVEYWVVASVDIDDSVFSPKDSKQISINASAQSSIG